jgi:hypothetical protein
MDYRVTRIGINQRLSISKCRQEDAGVKVEISPAQLIYIQDNVQSIARPLYQALRDAQVIGDAHAAHKAHNDLTWTLGDIALEADKL